MARDSQDAVTRKLRTTTVHGKIGNEVYQNLKGNMGYKDVVVEVSRWTLSNDDLVTFLGSHPSFHRHTVGEGRKEGGWRS